MRSWNKKGEDESESEGMSSFVKIFIVVLFLLFFFVVGSKLYAAFFGIEKGTMDSFNALADNFELMLQRQTRFEQFTMTFTSNDKSVIAANSCGNIPCLCIYKDAAKYADNNPWKCRNFDPAKLKVKFNKLTFYNLRELSFIESEQCLGQDIPAPGRQDFRRKFSEPSEEFPVELLYPVFYQPLKFPLAMCGTQYLLYIEKYVYDADKIFLSVGENLQEETKANRIETLSDCPSDSPDACKGARRNSKLIDGGFCYYDTQKKTCKLIEGFKTCEPNKEVTDSCLCGTQMIFKNSWYKYCAAGTDSKYALPFICSETWQCSDYCNAKTKSPPESCDTFEIQYCDRNVCDKEQSGRCIPSTTNSGTTCIDYNKDNYEPDPTPNTHTSSSGIGGSGTGL